MLLELNDYLGMPIIKAKCFRVLAKLKDSEVSLSSRILLADQFFSLTDLLVRIPYQWQPNHLNFISGSHSETAENSRPSAEGSFKNNAEGFDVIVDIDKFKNKIYVFGFLEQNAGKVSFFFKFPEPQDFWTRRNMNWNLNKILWIFILSIFHVF